jgi:SAM-dependent methyltransferase
MKECSKSISRRLSNPNFMRLYFKGNGIDIGGKPDPLALYAELFPLVTSIRTWDLEDGDAQYLDTVSDETYDFVHSSHCLEHLHSPVEGLENWLRILKPNGYLLITVPDEDLYEQGVFPSTYNKDHKWTFTIYKHSSWSPYSINIIDIIKTFGDDIRIEKIELLNSTYRTLPRYDQTLTPVAESSIEIVIYKKSKQEKSIKLNEEMSIHLNQYRDDFNTFIINSMKNPPFKNKKRIS